jgi:hypothetical protein
MHRRSDVKLRKRLIRRLIFTHAYRDREIGETVCRLNRVEVLTLAPTDELLVSLVPNVERGEVLVDSRGQGSFQHR